MYESCDVHHAAPGETIFHEGAPGDCAYIIEEGIVEISVTRDGRKVVVGRRKAGEVFGEMAIIDHRPRTATVSCLTHCKLVKIDGDLIQNRLSHSDPILRMYLEVILSRFRETMEGLQQLSIGEAPTNVPSYQLTAESQVTSSDYGFAIHEMRLEDELARAIKRNEFVLYLQPIVDLGNKGLVGFEALIRWEHQQRGLLSPDAFLETAEASGLIVPMGSWVLRRACGFLGALNAELRAYHMPPLFISVNVSAKEVASAYFAEAVARIVKDARLSPSDVKLEITETALIEDYAAAAFALRQLKDEGFSIVLDDFGTGYSSLSYLHQFPFDTLKIDRSFVQHVHQTPKNRAILASSASLADHLDLSVVAEGIETAFQEKIIRDLRCAYGQGYLYAKPMSESLALEFSYQWKKSKSRGLIA